MAGGPSKVNPPNSHPANPIHKQATEAQGIAPKPAQPATPAPATPTTTQAAAPAQPQAAAPAQPQAAEPADSHHVNKTLVAVGVFAVVGFIVYASS